MSLGSRNFGQLATDGPGEFRCDVCNARCTKSPIDATEFGHKVGYPRRPAHFHGGASGTSYHRPVTDGGAER